VGGDVLHTHERVHTVPLNKAYILISRLREIAPTYVLVWNHDAINNQIFLTDQHWMNGMKEWANVVIVDQVRSLVIDDMRLVFVPYVPNGRFVEALDTLHEDWRDATCIFAHQEFAGCKMGAITSIDGDRWSEDLPQVVSGHIHSKQRPQTNIFYPGSSLQVAFGESQSNIIPVLTFEGVGEMYEADEVDLGLPRKKIVNMDVDEIARFTPPEDGDKVRLTLSGCEDQFKAIKKTLQYKKLVERGVKIVFRKKRSELRGAAEAQVPDGVHFTEILDEMVAGRADQYLNQSYHLVGHGKEVDLDDMIFI
jgi:hypothetical protein